MILFELFLGFLKVGCFSFGGAYAAIPLIRDVVINNGWLDDEMLAYMIAVSESTPGPIMVNVATYVGASQAGILGAVVATFAVVLPAFLIVIAITATFNKVMNNEWFQAILYGIKPSIIGIIFVTGLVMIINNLGYSFEMGVDVKSAVLTAVLCVGYLGQKYIFKKKLSPIVLICISAVLGCVVYSV